MNLRPAGQSRHSSASYFAAPTAGMHSVLENVFTHFMDIITGQQRQRIHSKAQGNGSAQVLELS